MFESIIEKIHAAESIAIFTHQNPDGDALGSSCALKFALVSIGKRVKIFTESTNSTVESRLILDDVGNEHLSDGDAAFLKNADLMFSLDSAESRRLGMYECDFVGNTIAIDHHKSHIAYANITLVNSNASSTSEIIFELIKRMGVNINRSIARSLYIGIVSDTGCFKYSSTTRRTHEIAGELIETGIDSSLICRRLFDTNTMEFLRAFAISIEKLRFFRNNKIGLLHLNKIDFEKAGIEVGKCDSLVYIPRSILGVEIAIYIREKNGQFRVSLRSNSYANVNNIAKRFGGGGHFHASAFSIETAQGTDIEDKKKSIVSAAIAELDNNHNNG